jgi:hypothetical protein
VTSVPAVGEIEIFGSFGGVGSIGAPGRRLPQAESKKHTSRKEEEKNRENFMIVLVNRSKDFTSGATGQDYNPAT